MRIDLLGANWYAELYASGLIADGDGWYFHAVKYVMKLDFSTDGIFSITLYLGKKKNISETIWLI